jgi:hypothetical protein
MRPGSSARGRSHGAWTVSSSSWPAARAPCSCRRRIPRWRPESPSTRRTPPIPSAGCSVPWRAASRWSSAADPRRRPPSDASTRSTQRSAGGVPMAPPTRPASPTPCSGCTRRSSTPRCGSTAASSIRCRRRTSSATTRRAHGWGSRSASRRFGCRRRWMDGMVSSGEVHVTPDARRIARTVLYPSRFPPRLAWDAAHLVSLSTLSPELRRQYGIRWSARREHGMQRLSAASRHALPFLPAVLRVAPRARAADRRVAQAGAGTR